MSGDVSSWLVVGIFTPSEPSFISLMGTIYTSRRTHMLLNYFCLANISKIFFYLFKICDLHKIHVRAQCDKKVCVSFLHLKITEQDRRHFLLHQIFLPSPSTSLVTVSADECWLTNCWVWDFTCTSQHVASNLVFSNILFFFFHTKVVNVVFKNLLLACNSLKSHEFRPKYCEVNESLCIDFHTFQCLCYVFISMDIGSIPSERSLRLAKSGSKVPWKQKARIEAIDENLLITGEFT